MPVATVSNEIIHKDLKSAPPDGFVDLRQLPYGKMLRRRDTVTRMSIDQEIGKRSKDGDTQKMNLEMMQEEANFQDFRECIVNHNLTDENGQTLDFNNRIHFNMLNPKIGIEIEELIGELNQPEDEDDLDLFPRSSTASSENGTSEV